MRTNGLNQSGRRLACGVLALCVWISLPTAAQTNAASPGPLTGLIPHHATVSVENLDRMIAWYERVMGFTLTHRSDTNSDFVVANMSIKGYRIDLVRYKGSTRPAPVNPRYLQQGWIHVAFGVPDLPAAFAKLQALQTDVTADKDASGAITRVIVHDPEGNELEFFKPL